MCIKFPSNFWMHLVTNCILDSAQYSKCISQTRYSIQSGTTFYCIIFYFWTDIKKKERKENVKHIQIKTAVKTKIFGGIFVLHCMKIVQISSFFWSLFSCIRTEYRDLLRVPLRKILTFHLISCMLSFHMISIPRNLVKSRYSMQCCSLLTSRESWIC